MTTTIDSSNKGYHIIEGLTANESTDTLKLGGVAGVVGAVHVIDGGGTGFNGGTATLEGSIDGTNWFTLQDSSGVDITFTADGYAEINTAVLNIRVTADASISDVDVGFCFKR